MTSPDEKSPRSVSRWLYAGKYFSRLGNWYAALEPMPEFEDKTWLVEAAEYDRVCAERDEAERQYKLYKRFTDRLTERVKELEQECEDAWACDEKTGAKLRTACEALEFYADRNNWHVEALSDYDNRVIDDSDSDYSGNTPDWHGGIRARTALAKIKESET